MITEIIKNTNLLRNTILSFSCLKCFSRGHLNKQGVEKDEEKREELEAPKTINIQFTIQKFRLYNYSQKYNIRRTGKIATWDKAIYV